MPASSIELSDKWTLWAHLPHDTDWSLKSYKNIMTISRKSEAASLLKYLPEKMVQNCMLFMMRENISPIWEDKLNRNGGCFSYKVSNNNVYGVWKKVCYLLLGSSITKNKSIMNDINGITISPKKSFCILKIWLANCAHQNPKSIASVKGLNSHGCIFKKHRPQF